VCVFDVQQLKPNSRLNVAKIKHIRRTIADREQLRGNN
jgi:hypothetical protein